MARTSASLLLRLWSSLRRSALCMTGPKKVHVNNCIRVKDKVRPLTAGELRSLMREKHALKEGCKQFVLMGDVSKAHHRVKVRRRDWGTGQGVGQHCEHVRCLFCWVLVARVAAALLVRLFYYILSLAGDQDALLNADDLFTTAGTKQGRRLARRGSGASSAEVTHVTGWATGSISRIMRWASRGLEQTG